LKAANLTLLQESNPGMRDGMVSLQMDIGEDGRSAIAAALEAIYATDADALEEAPCAERPGDDGERSFSICQWMQFCERVVACTSTPSCVIDFPYADAGGLDLWGDDRLLERMYCFHDPLDTDPRCRLVVVHVQSLQRWGDRMQQTTASRIHEATSVNARHATRPASGGSWKQEGCTFKVVPQNRKLQAWHTLYNSGRSGESSWHPHTPGSVPPGDSWAANKYEDLRKVISAGDSLCGTTQVTYTKHQTAMAMRGGEGGEEVEFEVMGVSAGIGPADAMVAAAMYIAAADWTSPKVSNDSQRAALEAAVDQKVSKDEIHSVHMIATVCTGSTKKEKARSFPLGAKVCLHSLDADEYNGIDAEYNYVEGEIVEMRGRGLWGVKIGQYQDMPLAGQVWPFKAANLTLMADKKDMEDGMQYTYNRLQYGPAIKAFNKFLHFDGFRNRCDEFEAYFTLGHCYSSLDKHALAMNMLTMAENLLEGDNPSEAMKDGRLRVCNCWAECHYRTGNFDGAITQWKRVQEIAQELGLHKKRQEGLAVGLNGLGCCYEAQENYEEAIKHLEQAKTIFDKEGNLAQQGSVLGNLVACYTKLKDYPKAIELCGEGTIFAKETGNLQLQGVMCNKFGAIYKMLGQHQDAIEAHKTAISFARK